MNLFKKEIMKKMKGIPKIAFDKATQYAELKHEEEYRAIAESELDFARGFIAGYDYSENSWSDVEVVMKKYGAIPTDWRHFFDDLKKQKETEESFDGHTLSKHERRLEGVIDKIRKLPTLEAIGLLDRFVCESISSYLK